MRVARKASKHAVITIEHAVITTKHAVMSRRCASLERRRGRTLSRYGNGSEGAAGQCVLSPCGRAAALSRPRIKPEYSRHPITIYNYNLYDSRRRKKGARQRREYNHARSSMRAAASEAAHRQQQQIAMQRSSPRVF